MSALDEIEARLAAATPGPWETVSRHTAVSIRGDGHGIASAHRPWADRWIDGPPPVLPDAELIAHAPADLAALVAVVRAVAGLHVRRVPRPESGCRECGQVYPCSTVRALDDLYDVPF